MPALELNRRFYSQSVRPALDKHFPNLPHAAALIGYGSEVLGFDTEMSMDHNWYPRVYLFVREKDQGLIPSIHEMLKDELPHEFLGFPVDTVPVPDEPGTRWMKEKHYGPVDHAVAITTVRDFTLDTLGWDVNDPLTAVDWLTFPSQILRTMTAGAVYFDNAGELTRLREALAWYPQDTWLYLLASTWDRIGQEEHLMPRAGFEGDELGSAIIGSRLVRDIMSLSFLMEKQYAPYPKWFGSGFSQLSCSGELTPILCETQKAENWKQRQGALCKGYESLVRKHNSLGITEPFADQVSSFHGRPFQVIHGDRIAQAIAHKITGIDIKELVSKGLIGGIDQWSDSSELKSNPGHWHQAIDNFYKR